MRSPYTRFHQAIDGEAFPLGPCDALYFARTITASACVATAADNTTGIGIP